MQLQFIAKDVPPDSTASADDVQFFSRGVLPRPTGRPGPPRGRPCGRGGGDLVHGFRLLAKLGQGATSVVFEARHEPTGRHVALKTLRVQRDDVFQRFLREGHVGTEVRHENLAAVFEVVHAPCCAFLVMELVPGTTLRARLKQATASGGVMGREESLRIATSLCEGLVAAHGAGVVHRDVKPENVLLSGGGVVKLIDFGIAKICGRPDAPPGSARDHTLLTGDGVILGTPGYMSPEQARGTSLDARTDVFSVGVVLYEMLTGARPFAGDSALAALFAVDREQPVPPSLRNAAVDPALERLVLRCLEKDPTARPAGASELLGHLRTLRRSSRSRV